MTAVTQELKKTLEQTKKFSWKITEKRRSFTFHRN